MRDVPKPSHLQAAIMRGAIDVDQIDSCRLGGERKSPAVMLMAVKYNLPQVLRTPVAWTV
jgi:L-alanine-DL-glutamate epimerase-like enolase superfamily enzyme